MGLYGQPYVLNDATNENILVSPMMFIQKYLSGGIVYARQTGYICACAIVFGLFVMCFSVVERRISAGGKRKSRYAAACKAYYEDKAYLETDKETRNG